MMITCSCYLLRAVCCNPKVFILGLLFVTSCACMQVALYSAVQEHKRAWTHKHHIQVGIPSLPPAAL